MHVFQQMNDIIMRKLQGSRPKQNICGNKYTLDIHYSITARLLFKIPFI